MRLFDPEAVKIGLVTDMGTAYDFLEWIKNVPDQLVAVDVETAGLNWYDDELRLVQFGTLTEGWAVPFQDNRMLVREALNILNARGKVFVGHNFKFDLHFIERNTGWLPREWRFVHDTMNLAKVLNSSGASALKDLAEFYVWRGAKLGQDKLKEDMKQGGWTWATVPVTLPSYWVYGVLDTIMTANLFYVLWERCRAADVLKAYVTEMGAFPALYAVERKGMLLDSEHARNQMNRAHGRMAYIEEEVRQFGIDNIGSNDQIALAFERAGVELTETTPTGRWKMDADTFDLIAATSDHPLVGLVKEYRSQNKMASTYYENFLKFQRSDGRCHPFYWAVTARTGRMSATEPAILTVPRPDDDKPEHVRNVRNSFVAPEGHVIVSTDFSNVEARIFAHFANEEGMKQAFREGLNLHKFTASQIFGKPYEQIDKSHSEYTTAKNTLFCTLFGGGGAKIAITAGISLEEGKAAQSALYAKFPGMKQFQREMIQIATDNLNAHGQAFIRGFDGRILAMVETDDRYYAFTNWKIQSTANVVLKQRLAVIDAMGLSDYCIAVIHDEVVAEIPEDFEEEYKQLITDAMTDESSFSVPIVCAVGDGASKWGDAK
jgi:DNA polymerase-1